MATSWVDLKLNKMEMKVKWKEIEYSVKHTFFFKVSFSTAFTSGGRSFKSVPILCLSKLVLVFASPLLNRALRSLGSLIICKFINSSSIST